MDVNTDMLFSFDENSKDWK